MKQYKAFNLDMQYFTIVSHVQYHDQFTIPITTQDTRNLLLNFPWKISTTLI